MNGDGATLYTIPPSRSVRFCCSSLYKLYYLFYERTQNSAPAFFSNTLIIVVLSGVRGRSLTHQVNVAREWQKVATILHSNLMQATADKAKLQDSNYTLLLENRLMEGEVSHLHQLHGIGVEDPVETAGKVDASTNTDTDNDIDSNANGNARPNDPSPTKKVESPSGAGRLGST